MKQRKIVFTAAFIMIFCCSASAAFSVFSKPLQVATGGDASQVALTLTIYQTFMAIFGILSGKIVDKSGPKKLMFIGGIVFGLGWALTAFASSIPMLYLTTGFIAGAGNGLLYNPSLNMALKWFPEKKGTISGLLLASASVGPLALSKVGAILCQSMGTTGFIYIGVAYAVLVCISSLFAAVPDAGWTPDGYTPAAMAANNSAKDYTPSEMLKTSKFYVMLILFALSCTAGIMMIGSLSTIAQTQLGVDPIVASNFVAINCIANLCGRLIIGKFCDQVGEAKTLVGILIITALSLFGLKLAGSNMAFFIVCLVLLGGTFGGVLVVYPPLTAKNFGMKNQGMNYGIMFFAYAIGSLLGPQIAAKFVDVSAGFMAYGNVYMVAIGVAIVAIILDVVLIKNMEA
ncbi:MULTISPECIES: OFA family MFS transporter [Coprobacillaceae]|uniref:L-lactate MFS transporter n=1 Tax=Coprobacillaceae TaxID=2810280 RepID=UPI000E53D692|nr:MULTISPECIES: OFA family MFS transporter [Coprobacillaceae]RHM60331.1 MFS transporter [Coprobacillus sp. AF33-1AC]RHS92888.1 MFS transporter [Erysipelatoclostridium sp. AM42-17]